MDLERDSAVPDINNRERTTMEDGGQRVIPLSVVSLHDSPGDCWVVVYDRVYDITPMLHEHPGGMEILLENAGRDVSLAFQGVGHSRAALAALKAFQVGVLPDGECIFNQRPGHLRVARQPSSAAMLYTP
ncbi:uncharacterized protein LOC113215991 [Frankliniella occidentalis]|uniref:Uncharacterized protein LOC113215991 n=1 Tax=Frankliniella occidentalis TaxID=133901 RepID=A0A9C6XD08_FRAOC|nr:uncharacterized protein LOC113215991 [Frankliniella occidentalis]